jgi:hypothetical protein
MNKLFKEERFYYVCDADKALIIAFNDEMT